MHSSVRDGGFSQGRSPTIDVGCHRQGLHEVSAKLQTFDSIHLTCLFALREAIDERSSGTKMRSLSRGGGIEPLTPAEIVKLQPDIPEWSVIREQNINRLQRVFTFPDFKSAMEFSVRVGEDADDVGHHPAILTEWGKVTVTWWTHAIGGLHNNDFIMAARTDKLAG